MNTKRKLAWIAQIDSIVQHPNADTLDICTIGGWKVVSKMDLHNPGDRVIYCSIDSWIPEKVAPFLCQPDNPRYFNGVHGERLRTARLRGQVSQGLILPLSVMNEFGEYSKGITRNKWESSTGAVVHFELGSDVTDYLGILKYEKVLPECLIGEAIGYLPSDVPVTNAERIQNLPNELEEWKSQNLEFECTEKLEGTSMTVFIDEDDQFRVCGHHLMYHESDSNAFWYVANKYKLEEPMRRLNADHNIRLAIQGELVGGKIQSNIYKLTDYDWYVFNVYNIKTGEYLTGKERVKYIKALGLKSVPSLGTVTIKNDTIDSLVEIADGNSYLNPKQSREGLVFRCTTDSTITFKAISNKYLLKVK